MAALKVLSGTLFVKNSASGGGLVTLDFNAWAFTDLGDARLAETNVSGAAGRFEAPPGKIVSLRRFSEKGKRNSSIDLTDSIPTQDGMTVRWTTLNADVREISVLIVGEA